MSVLIHLIGIGCLISVVFYFWDEISSTVHSYTREEFVNSAFKGFVVPAVIWIAFCCGLIPGLGAIHPEVRGGNWAGLNPWTVSLRVGSASLLTICSFWAAVTLTWMVVDIGLISDKKNNFVMLTVFWSVVMLPIVAGLIWRFRIEALGVGVALWMMPILHYTITLMPVQRRQPLYSRAVAKMKFGKDREAEVEVIRELEKCEDDYNGWMMLAELYATRFNDMGEADRTVRSLCNQKNVSGIQISIALCKLADWHLIHAKDPQSARTAVELIIEKLPGTHFAKMANQRLASMPRTADELLAQLQPRRISLQKATKDYLRNDNCITRMHAEPRQRANQLAELLLKRPSDYVIREELAMIYAEELGMASEGVEQLKLLIGSWEQSDNQIARWKCLMADWHLRHLNDPETGCNLLKEVVQDYPGTSYAFEARQRLNLISMETKLRRTEPAR